MASAGGACDLRVFGRGILACNDRRSLVVRKGEKVKREKMRVDGGEGCETEDREYETYYEYG